MLYISRNRRKKELAPQIKFLDTPDGFRVFTNYEKNQIELTWSEVEGATHYQVEYESVVDYLSGNEMKKYITLTPSFSLSSFSSSSDKRYVFRVRAGKKSDEGVLFSLYSDLKEGAEGAIYFTYSSLNLYLNASYEMHVNASGSGSASSSTGGLTICGIYPALISLEKISVSNKAFKGFYGGYHTLH